jgi:hypothetical protein
MRNQFWSSKNNDQLISPSPLSMNNS